MTATFRILLGNRTKMTVTSGGGQDSLEVDYTYNLSNQLKKLKVTQLGMTLKEVDYISNGDGQRMQKTVLWYGVPFVTNYVLDGVHVILEKTEEGDTTMRYIPGVAMIMGSGETAGTRFYLHDALGNVIALVNIPEGSGAPQVTQVYQYDGFGNPLILSQTWEMWNGALTVTDEVPNPYRWNGASGYYWDEDTGLYLMGLRWYDSTTGRFLTRDPIGFGGGDANLYRYVGNNPLNVTDCLGLGPDETTRKRLAQIERLKAEVASDKRWGWTNWVKAPFEITWKELLWDVPNKGSAIMLDSVNPFGNPYADAGYYDVRDCLTVAPSKTAGQVAGVAIAAVAILELWAFLFVAPVVQQASRAPNAGEVTVSRWPGPASATPEVGTWVMRGEATRANYVLSFKWQPQWFPGNNMPASYDQGRSYIVDKASVLTPPTYKSWFNQAWYLKPPADPR